MTSVVFDVGNVLIDWDAKRVYRDYFDSDAEIEDFFAEIEFYTWNLQLDRGGTFTDAVFEHSARHPERAELIARYDRHWHLSVPGAIDGAVDLRGVADILADVIDVQGQVTADQLAQIIFTVNPADADGRKIDEGGCEHEKDRQQPERERAGQSFNHPSDGGARRRIRFPRLFV